MSHHPARILVVDDEEVVRELVGEILRRSGYDVLTVASVDDAIALLDDPALGLVITDLVMPRGSGLDLVAETRLRRPGVNVLLITGAMSEPPAAGLSADAADRLLAKPFTHAQLLEAVTDLLPGQAAKQA